MLFRSSRFPSSQVKEKKLLQFHLQNFPRNSKSFLLGVMAQDPATQQALRLGYGALTVMDLDQNTIITYQGLSIVPAMRKEEIGNLIRARSILKQFRYFEKPHRS